MSEPHVYDRVECPVCHRSIAVSKERVMRPHRNANGAYLGQCPGASRRYAA